MMKSTSVVTHTGNTVKLSFMTNRQPIIKNVVKTNIVVEKDNDIDNVNAWDEKLVIIPVRQKPKYINGGMVHYIDTLKKIIINKASEPQILISQEKELYLIFQNKVKDNMNEWLLMIQNMMHKFELIDAMYSQDKKKYPLINKTEDSLYYGFKEKLIHDIANMLISYILIGENTREGSGMYDDNNDSIIDMINNYLVNLNNVFEFISHKYPERQKKYCNHSNLNRKKNDFKLKHENMLKLNSDLLNDYNFVKKKDRLVKKEEALAYIKKQIINNNNLLAELKVLQLDIEKELSSVNEERSSIDKVINQKYDELSSCLKFSYFMHDGWCSSIDRNVYPKKNIIKESIFS